jgi:hypothetical protein
MKTWKSKLHFAAPLALIAAGFLAEGAPANAATDNAQERRDSRDHKQDTRKGSRDTKQKCRAEDQKSNSDCRQDHRETKQKGRQDARDIKYK